MDSLPKEDAIAFWYEHLKNDGSWLRSVWGDWYWENRETVSQKDINKLRERLTEFKLSGVDAVGDLDYLKTPYLKFVEETAFLEVFKKGKEITLTDVVKWAYKLNSDVDLSILVGYSDKNPMPSKNRKQIKALIKEINPRYKRELNKYFGIILSPDHRIINKMLSKVGYVLKRFGLELNLVQKRSNTRDYKVISLDNELQSVYRKKLKILINKTLKKPVSKGGETLTQPEFYTSAVLDDESIYSPSPTAGQSNQFRASNTAFVISKNRSFDINKNYYQQIKALPLTPALNSSKPNTFNNPPKPFHGMTFEQKKALILARITNGKSLW